MGARLPRRPELEHPDEPLDPGMQAERTYLSWQRTGLGMGGVGALLLHSAVDGHPVLTAPGIVTLVIAAALAGRAQSRYRTTVAAVKLGRTTADRRVVATTAVLTTLLCLISLVIVTVV